MQTQNTALVDIVAAISDVCNEAKVDLAVRTGPDATYPSSLFIMILILKNLFGFTSETSFLRYLGNHHDNLFPLIPERSWFNRKAKKLVEEEQRIHGLLLQKLGVEKISIRIVDTTGIPVVKLHRSRRSKGFARKHEVNYGYCASKDAYYYGEKLTLFVTPQGIPTAHILTPANIHDVRALKENISGVACELKRKTIVADKGYYDGDLEITLKERYKAKLVVPEKRRHQKKNTPEEKALLKQRQIVETVNEQLQDQMGIDRTRAKSHRGLLARIQSILLSFTFGAYFNMISGHPLLSMKSVVI